MDSKTAYENGLIMVPEEYLNAWYVKGVQMPSSWMKIEVDGNAITGGRTPDDFATDFPDYKDFNPLVSPFYINCRTASDEHGFHLTSNNNYAYAYTPVIFAISLGNSANICNGLQDAVGKQSGQKKPEITMTFHDVDAPKENKVNVLSEYVCEKCEVLGFQVRRKIIHIKVHFGDVVLKNKDNGGNILMLASNIISPKGA